MVIIVTVVIVIIIVIIVSRFSSSSSIVVLRPGLRHVSVVVLSCLVPVHGISSSSSAFVLARVSPWLIVFSARSSFCAGLLPLSSSYLCFSVSMQWLIEREPK